jgi:hypothetical protein
MMQHVLGFKKDDLAEVPSAGTQQVLCYNKNAAFMSGDHSVEILR